MTPISSAAAVGDRDALARTRLRIADEIEPDEECLEVDEAYRPAYEASVLLNFAGHPSGLFVDAGALAFFKASTNGLAKQAGGIFADRLRAVVDHRFSRSPASASPADAEPAPQPSPDMVLADKVLATLARAALSVGGAGENGSQKSHPGIWLLLQPRRK